MGKVINIILVEFATHENKCCTYVNKLKKKKKVRVDSDEFDTIPVWAKCS